MLQSLTFPPNASSRFPVSTISVHHRTMRCRAAVADPPATGIRKPPASLYEVLRVKHNASLVEIKAAYRSLAKLYHPDAASSSSDDDGRQFIQIHNAYETLSDPSARALYDLSLGGLAAIRDPDRFRQQSSSPFSCYSVGRRPSRRWETDQCW